LQLILPSRIGHVETVAGVAQQAIMDSIAG
jgi:hypothetical protein